MSEHINTEGPTGGESVAAGGRDEAKEAAIAAEAESTHTPESAAAGNREPENLHPGAEETRTTSGEQATETPQSPTPEEQAEIDAMVDYTIKDGDIEKMPDDVREKFLADGGKVGDTIKLSKDHPLLSDGTETPEPETAQ